MGDRVVFASILLGGLGLLQSACDGHGPVASVHATGSLNDTLRAESLAERPHEPSDPAIGSGGAGVIRNVGFMGEPEQPVIDRLARGRIVGVTKGSRGLGFKLELEDGSAGYFRPEQSSSRKPWYAEVVAYYLDRALGLGRVPPAVSRRVPWAALAPAAGTDPRAREVIVAGDGTVRGALVAWLTQPLEPAHTPAGWENWIRIEPFPTHGVTPYQRASAYASALQRREELGENGEPYYDRAPAPDRADRAAELSDLIVFDFLAMNAERWRGDNGGVRLLGRGGPLVFLDNAAGFAAGPLREELLDARLKACQRFRARTIDALEALDVGELGRVLSRDPLAPLLSDEQLEGLALRRRAVLEHVQLLRKRFGDDAVFPW